MTSTGFFSSFEAGDPQPVTSGVQVDSGPRRSPTAKAGVGFTGLRALRYSAGPRTVLFEVDVAVTAHSALSYVVFPDSDGAVPSYRSTYVTLDAEFDDGSRAGFTAAAQGAAKTLYVDQWNLVRHHLGAYAGRRVRRIVLLVEPPGEGEVTGWLDDVRLAEHRTVPKDPVDHVRTTRGTHSSGEFSRGNTFPATAVPHGFNFWTPVTDARALNWFYSYHRHNDARNEPRVQALGLSHQPSPWMGDRHTFHLMPGTGPVEPDRGRRALAFSHEDEIDRPYHYGVRFRCGVTADLAPADHAALVRFTYPGSRGWVLFDNVRNRGGLRVHADTGVLTGHTWVRSRLSTGARRMFLYAEADQRPTGGGRIRRGVTGYLEFAEREVTLRIATSLISLAQAKRNLELEIPAGTTFEQVRDLARAQWQRLLGRIELEGASDDELTTFYSCLYRLFLYPNRAHENTPRGIRHASPVVRSFRPSTRRRTGAKTIDGELYVNNGFWDTYRTTWPAYALFAPQQCGRMIDGFVQQYREGGWIARWSSPGYADLMTGTSSDAAFADAYLKGVTNFDVEAAYDAALKNATVAPPWPGVGRKGLDRSAFLGYTPTSVREGLSWALEGCLNDFALANLSDALARQSSGARARRYADNAVYLRHRAQHYVHHFDPRIGFFQGRTPAGGRHYPADGYDPEAWGDDFVETNAWNTAFSAPHDGPGLAALHGGTRGLEAKLDEFFRIPETGHGGRIHEMTEARDVRMGQYGHSNQPSHHIPFVYAFAGAPAKLQRTVREVLRRLYLGSELGQGYPGDEDNGEMSAWYVFTALGLYPLTVGSPSYVACAPLFRTATVHLDNGKDLVIRAPRAGTADGTDTPYVHGLTVDGEPHPSATLTHAVLTRGAVLDFDVRAEPGTWGTEPVNPAPPAPLTDLTGTAHSPDGPAHALTDDTSRTQATFHTRTPVLEFTVDGPPREVVLYTLTSGTRRGDPRAWTLEGSDDRHHWHVLDERFGELFRWRRHTRPFTLAAPAAHRHYRLRITASSGRTAVTLAQWELLAR
ncbi:GH92 family glycosyl hydrolase [Amycolatopsis jiangsuensis]|uniref:Putative alpha-1,2-mannosidase n=1 Tax=Amycolatopsis jiangsuensis TaxID=1181879 RepID=A0A840INM9_9PSEU|nr:GH92 family glycosyl hydrolase [Amycolatopsis jiangsuensis]MBB4683493.1 putative alpha-1,2-mannosidase [Amycolatopsis jiangsuensis]